MKIKIYYCSTCKKKRATVILDKKMYCNDCIGKALDKFLKEIDKFLEGKGNEKDYVVE